MEQSEIFLSNVPLLWANREMILREPRYNNIDVPSQFSRASRADSGVMLGELLRLWIFKPVFSSVCQKCGGKAVVYRFNDIPQSSAPSEPKNICVACGQKGEGAGTSSLGALWRVLDLWRTRNQFFTTKAKETASLVELVEACKKK